MVAARNQNDFVTGEGMTHRDKHTWQAHGWSATLKSSPLQHRVRDQRLNPSKGADGSTWRPSKADPAQRDEKTRFTASLSSPLSRGFTLPGEKRSSAVYTEVNPALVLSHAGTHSEPIQSGGTSEYISRIRSRRDQK